MSVAGNVRQAGGARQLAQRPMLARGEAAVPVPSVLRDALLNSWRIAIARLAECTTLNAMVATVQDFTSTSDNAALVQLAERCAPGEASRLLVTLALLSGRSIPAIDIQCAQACLELDKGRGLPAVLEPWRTTLLSCWQSVSHSRSFPTRDLAMHLLGNLPDA